MNKLTNWRVFCDFQWKPTLVSASLSDNLTFCTPSFNGIASFFSCNYFIVCNNKHQWDLIQTTRKWHIHSYKNPTDMKKIHVNNSNMRFCGAVRTSFHTLNSNDFFINFVYGFILFNSFFAISFIRKKWAFLSYLTPYPQSPPLSLFWSLIANRRSISTGFQIWGFHFIYTKFDEKGKKKWKKRSYKEFPK